MLDLCMAVPLGIHFVSVINTLEYFCSFILRILEYILQQVLTILIPLQFLGSLLSPFLNIGVITTFLQSLGMRFSLYILFKNCSNLSLNSSGAYLCSSELMLSCPGVLPFFVNFNTFSSSSKVIKACKQSAELYSNSYSIMFVVFHNFSWYLRNTFLSMFP